MHILPRVIDKKNPRTVITDEGTNLLGWNRPSNEHIPVINLTRFSARKFDINVFDSLCTPYMVFGERSYSAIKNREGRYPPNPGSGDLYL